VKVGTIDGSLRPNVVAPGSQAVVDVRVPTLRDVRRVQERILDRKPVTPGVRLRIEGGRCRPPMGRTPGNRRLCETARRLGAEMGPDLEEGMAGGGSDGNTTSLFTATLDRLGAVGDGAHARHEFIYAHRMVERCALLALLLMEPPLAEKRSEP
jgi:glutamate carboxypeptidase